MGRLNFLLCLSLLVIGCASGHCRQQKDLPNSEPVPVNSASPEESQTEKSREKRIYVYKYDGSLQCGQGNPISVSSMETELKGIKIFNKEKKPDGLMHIQVCGSPTGMTNRFLIKQEDLDKATKLGFRQWTF